MKRFLTCCDRLIMPRRVLLPALTLLVIFLASCAPLRPELGPPVSSDFADSLMQKWRDKALSINSMQGLAKLKLEAPLNNISANQVLRGERPHRLRAETLS